MDPRRFGLAEHLSGEQADLPEREDIGPSDRVLTTRPDGVVDTIDQKGRDIVPSDGIDPM